MANHRDRLTGLLNRDGGFAAAARRVAEAQLKGATLALLWVDIDRFHTINHSFGHPSGDRFIGEMAVRIEVAAAQHGDLARISGDEFIVIVPSCDMDKAVALAEQIDDAVRRPTTIDGVTIHPTVSIGVAILGRGEDTVKVLLRADKAKMAAKQTGGNQWSVSGERLVHNGYRLEREELEIEAKLHRAIELGGLQLHYQPIVRIDGTVDAVEALMRCTIQGESISPGQFIPVAEKTGLITQLGEWTLVEGAHFAKRLLDAGLALKVAVNVSRSQLASNQFLKAVHSALICADLPARLLELELTESLFLDASPTVQANLRGAREAGLSLAIDDFGTGYSSLATLKDIPATKLKLDRSFIVVLPDDIKAFAVVRAMAGLGRELGLTVVAEGVETEGQRQCLEEIGVDAIQGYIYSAPMALDKLFGWLAELRQSSRNFCLI